MHTDIQPFSVYPMGSSSPLDMGRGKGGVVITKHESKNIFYLSGLLSNVINGAACVTDGLTEHKMLETDRTARGKMLVIDMFIQIQGVH